MLGRAEFDELSRILTVLEEAARWVRRGVISHETLKDIRQYYQSRQDYLEDLLGVSHSSRGKTVAAAGGAATPRASASAELSIPWPRSIVESSPGPADDLPLASSGPDPIPEDWPAPPLPEPAAGVPANGGWVPGGPLRALKNPITWERMWKSLFSERTLDFMLHLGALLFVASTGALATWYWTRVSTLVQGLIILSATGLAYAGGYFVRNRLGAHRSGTVITGIGSLFVPLNTVTIVRALGIGPAEWPLLWLISSLVMLLLNAVIARRLRAEFFAYIVLGSAVSVVASALRIGGLPLAWWGGPIVLLGVVFLLLAVRVSSPSLSVFRVPLRLSGMLLGVLPVPWVLWASGGIATYLSGGAVLPTAAPVASAWWAAAALAVVVVARRPTWGPVYGAAAAVVGACVFTAAAVAPVPWVSFALVLLAISGAVLEKRAAAFGVVIARACRHVAWACAAVAGAWSLLSLTTAAVALGGDAVLVLWWARLYSRRWMFQSGLILTAVWLTTAMLWARVPFYALGAGWIGLGVVYLAVASLRKASVEDTAILYLVAYGLAASAQVPAILWPSQGFRVLALGILTAVSAWSVRAGDHEPAVQHILGFLPSSWRKVVFVWTAVVLFPLSALLAWQWVFGMTPGAGVVASAIALAYSSAAYRLIRASSPRGVPFLLATFVLAAVAPILALPDPGALTLAFLGDTGSLAGLAIGFRSRRLADLATGASLAALVAQLRVGFPHTPVMLAAMALLYSLGEGQAGRIRGTDIFHQSLFWAGRVAAAAGLVAAVVQILDGQILSGLAGCASLALVLVVWSLTDQEPWSAVVGVAVATWGATVALNNGLLLRVGLPSGDSGPAWAGLALILGAVGIGLGRWRRSAAGLLPIAGTFVAIMGLLSAIGRPRSESTTLLLALILFAMCAIVRVRGRIPAMDTCLRWCAGSPAAERILRAGYVYLCAWLLPFWVYLMLSRHPMLWTAREPLGVGLVLLAWAYLGLIGPARAVDPAYGAPWLVTAPLLAAVGVIIAAPQRLPFIIADVLASVLCVALAAGLRTPRWLYPAAALAAPAWVAGWATVGLAGRFLGPALLAFAVGELGLAFWLDRRAGTAPGKIAPTALPFWIVGWILIPAALLWASTGGPTIALAAFLAGAAVYAAGGLRFRDALFSYPVTALLALSYVVGVFLLQDRFPLPTPYWSLRLLPGIAASMLVAWIMSRGRPPLRFATFLSRSPAAPLTVLACAGAVTAIVFSWTVPWLRVGVTAAAGVVYLGALGVVRLPGWLYPGLLAEHLAYGLAIWDAHLTDRAAPAVWFVPVMLAMIALGFVTSKGRDRGEDRTLRDRLRSAPWSAPFYVFAGAGILVWVIRTIPGTGAFALVLIAATVMIGATAAWWRDRRLALLAAVCAAASVLAVFLQLHIAVAAAEPAIALIALCFGSVWWAAMAAGTIARRGMPVTRLAHLWAAPLKLTAIVLVSAPLAGSVLGVFTGVPGSPHAFVLCLGLAGILAFVVTTLEGRMPFSYLAALMPGCAWVVWLFSDQIREVQFYAIPGALYLLWIGLVLDKSSRHRLADLMDGAGLALLLGSSLLQSVFQAFTPSGVIYGSLVAVESLGVLGWGFIRRRRRFAVAAVAVLLLDATALAIHPLVFTSRWIATAALGLALVLGALYVERKRETIARVSERWRTRIGEWR
jgi:hypothetical protein